MEDSLLKFASCMRKNGIADYPDPKFDNGSFTIGGPGLNPNSRAVRKAMEHCQKLMPLPGRGGGAQAAG